MDEDPNLWESGEGAAEESISTIIAGAESTARVALLPWILTTQLSFFNKRNKERYSPAIETAYEVGKLVGLGLIALEAYIIAQTGVGHEAAIAFAGANMGDTVWYCRPR